METTTAPDTLADPGQLAALLSVPAEHAGMLTALELASDRFRGATRRHISAVEEDVIVLDGDGTRTLLLPDGPIRDLVSVHVDDREVEDVEWSPANAVLRRRSRWPDRLGAIRVVYSHGYEKVPGDVADAVIGQARVIFRSVPGLSSMTVGGQSVAFSTGAGLAGGVTETWSTTVAAYRFHGDRA